ncbi:MAG: hypothetical protein C0508_24700, partial [Cyanobacteria bacterium PR.023]|nr:hypothetical protein [Cyanobacteria bacterium PR.023]
MAAQRSPNFPLPGGPLPDDLPPLPLVGGGSAQLSSVSDGRSAKLIVFYRGGFCPFCRQTLTDLQAKQPAVADAGWEVLAVSADTEEVAAKTHSELGLTFPVAHSLSAETMHRLGLYVSDPKNYIEQPQLFAEPAYILLSQDGNIRYRAEASHPMGGRPNIDALLMGFNY